MNCPSCAYQSPYSAIRCPQCRVVFDSDAVETLGHLVYLRDRLERWRAQGLLDRNTAAATLGIAEHELDMLARRLALTPHPAEAAASTAVTAAPTTAPSALLTVSESSAAEQVAPDAPTQMPPLVEAPLHAPMPVVEETPLAAAGYGPPPAAYGDETAEPALAAASLDQSAADTTDVGAPIPAPAASAGPSFEWRNIGTYLLSERTLHGLLGLGAFLILASGVVISTLNPTGLGPLPHLAAVVATTLLFFVSGYFVRQRLGLTIAGATLLGIAGAFVPLSIWTLGQRQILDWETGAVWLVASLVSLPLYLGAQRILRDRTFAVLSALAGGSELLAVLNWLGVPTEWGLAALVLLAIGYVRLGRRLERPVERPVQSQPGAGPSGLAWALAWTARLATPPLMATLLLAQLGSDAWLAMVGRPLGLWHEYAIGAGWWLGVLFYVQSARLLHRRRDIYAAAWTLPVAYLLTLTRAPRDAAWYDACLAVLALGYLLVGYRRLARADQAVPGTLPLSYLRLARQPYLQVAVVLTIVAAFWPSQTADSRIATLYLLALFFTASTVLLQLRAPGWLGVTLLGTAYGLTLDQVALARDARPLAWTGLAAALLAAGEIAVRRGGEGQRPLLRTIFGGPSCQSRLGAPLFAAGYLVSLIALALALNGYVQTPASVGGRHLSTPLILGFVGLLAALSASSIARRTGLFLYPVSWLALIPIGAIAVDIREWLGRTPHDADAARLLAGVGVVYLAIAWLADRQDGRHARPLYLAGYLLLPIAMLVSTLDRAVSLQVVGFSVLVYAVSAWLTHTGRLPSFERLVERLTGSGTSSAAATVRTLWVYLAVWLFPCWALIVTSLWEPPIAWYALVLSALALVYPAVGLGIRRLRLEYRWPWYLGGYALSAIAPLVALTDTTIRPVVLGLSIGLYVASAIIARRSAWLYPVAVLLPVLLWQALGALALFERWYGVGLVVLALVYCVAGLVLQPIGQQAHDAESADGEETASGSRWLIQGRVGPYALPFMVVGYALGAIGLARAANQERGLTTLAFTLATVQYAASAFVFRQALYGWATSIVAAVAYVAALSVLGLFERWLGVGLVALAIVFGAVGVGLHLIVTGERRLPIRGWISAYGMPFFVVGYLLGAFGLVVASTQEPALLTLAFALGAAQYALTAFVFREPLCGWVTAGLLTVAYVNGLTLTSIDADHRGLGLLPGGLIALLAAEALRILVPQEADNEGGLLGYAGASLRAGAARTRPAADVDSDEDADDVEGAEAVRDAAGPDDKRMADPADGGALDPVVSRLRRVTAWTLPWLLVAAAAAVAAPPISRVDQQTWTIAWWGGTLLFAAMTVLVRHPLPLYPTLIFGTIAYLAAGYLVNPPMSTEGSRATLAALVWIFLGLAWWLERRQPGSIRSLGSSWARFVAIMDPDHRGKSQARQPAPTGLSGFAAWTTPLHLAGWVTLVLTCVGSLPSAEVGLPATAAVAVLLALLTVLHGVEGYAWATFAVGVLVLVQGLRLAGVPLEKQPPYLAGAALIATVLSLRLRAQASQRIALWLRPLFWSSLAVASAAMVVALLVEVDHANRQNVELLALTIALTGLTVIAHAFGRREQRLVYLGVGLLEVGLVLELFAFEVGQPQAFVVPVGAYLLMIAYLEWRRGSARTVKRLLESSALIVLLGVSLLQALGFLEAGQGRYAYATFLLLESAGLLGLGAMLRWRYTFFAGALALVADVCILLADPLRALNTWYLVALIGLTLIGGVIWIERQRQQIPLWLEAWRARLEHWD